MQKVTTQKTQQSQESADALRPAVLLSALLEGFVRCITTRRPAG